MVAAKRRLAIVTSHPIQYYAPVFRAAAALGAFELRVFYTWSQVENRAVSDPGFQAEVAWDVPLLTGYDYRFVPNVAREPGTHHFFGLKNPTLNREITEWGADSILVFGWFAHSHLNALRYFKGRIPVLFRGDSTLLDQRSSWRTRLRRVFLRWVYRHVDVAIAVGSNSRDYFLWCGLPPARVAIAPHSVDVARFAADGTAHAVQAGVWRSGFGIAEDAVVLLYAGKFQAKKNPLLLLDAFCNLGGQVHLMFVGHGELESELRSRAAGSPKVHFLPFQNQSAMPAVYRLGDAFILPSRGPGETWGLALNEAMASGRPVIASSKVGGARDLIRPAITGWTFESDDSFALAEVLREVVGKGRAGLAAMGALAQAASADWSAGACASRIVSIVEDLPSSA